MRDAPDLLRAVAQALTGSGVPFMLTGSMAAAWHGAGRATMDIDFVIDPTLDQLAEFLRKVERPGLYVPADTAVEALSTRSMFNVIDVPSGWKADLMIRKARPFSRTEFDRRLPVEFDGLKLWLPTREDLIIAKLEWARLGESSRQLDDAAMLLRTAESIDRKYLDLWIEQLGLEEQWAMAQSRR